MRETERKEGRERQRAVSNKLDTRVWPLQGHYITLGNFCNMSESNTT